MQEKKRELIPLFLYVYIIFSVNYELDNYFV